jgi:hypothetical protein
VCSAASVKPPACISSTTCSRASLWSIGGPTGSSRFCQSTTAHAPPARRKRRSAGT